MMTKGPDIDFSIPEQLNLATYFLGGNIAAGRGEKVALYYGDKRHTFNDICSLTNKVGNVREASRHTRYPKATLVVGVPSAKLMRREHDFYSLVTGASDHLEDEPTHWDECA
jgi:hypothetical protein